MALAFRHAPGLLVLIHRMHRDTSLLWIKRLIWAYFWLLIFEGVLRKWMAPQWSDPIIFVRDLIVIALYTWAFLTRRFPWNRFVIASLWLGGVMLIAGMLPAETNVFVALYGWRVNFLHLPLVFLMAEVFTLQDVKAAGRWLLLLSLPMAVLMVLQFNAPYASWLNAGAGGEPGQLGAAFGRIRPAGTFAYGNGISLFYPLVLAFVLFAEVIRGAYPLWLRTAGGIGILVAVPVSGSRSLLLCLALVGGAYLLLLVIQPRALATAGRFLIVAAIAGAAVASMEFFGEGFEVLQERFVAASLSEGGVQGAAGRFVSIFTEPIPYLFNAPIFGYGLGLGTNGGATLAVGHRTFLLAEGEWARIILESGAVLGLLFILLRIVIVSWLAWLSLRACWMGNVLPLLILGAAAFNFLIGPFGQPTQLGFSVFGAGLCLAAMRPADEEDHEEDMEAELEEEAANAVSADLQAP